MRRIKNILLLLFAAVTWMGLGAWQKSKPSQKVLMPNVYLGNSEYKAGPISKSSFINLMKQGLTSHDDHGDVFRVTGFDFSYAEQKLYEDSMGNMVVMMDMSSEHCDGDTLSSDIAYANNMLKSVYLTDSADIPKGLYERIKPGDTVYFDHIKLVDIKRTTALSLDDTTTIAGKGIKLYIVK